MNDSAAVEIHASVDNEGFRLRGLPEGEGLFRICGARQGGYVTELRRQTGRVCMFYVGEAFGPRAQRQTAIVIVSTRLAL